MLCIAVVLRAAYMRGCHVVGPQHMRFADYAENVSVLLLRAGRGAAVPGERAGHDQQRVQPRDRPCSAHGPAVLQAGGCLLARWIVRPSVEGCSALPWNCEAYISPHAFVRALIVSDGLFVRCSNCPSPMQ